MGLGHLEKRKAYLINMILLDKNIDKISLSECLAGSTLGYQVSRLCLVELGGIEPPTS